MSLTAITRGLTRVGPDCSNIILHYLQDLIVTDKQTRLRRLLNKECELSHWHFTLRSKIGIPYNLHIIPGHTIKTLGRLGYPIYRIEIVHYLCLCVEDNGDTLFWFMDNAMG